MLQRAGQLSNLKAMIHSPNLPKEISEVVDLINPNSQPMRQSHKKPTEFDDGLYDILLRYLNFAHPETNWVHCKDLQPYPPPRIVVSPWYISHPHLNLKGSTYTTFDKHKGNSIISYKVGDTRAFGSIRFMFTLVDPLNQITTFFLVLEKYLISQDFLNNWKHLNIYQALGADDNTIISSEDIQGHCAYYSCPGKPLVLLVRLNLLVEDHFGDSAVVEM